MRQFILTINILLFTFTVFSQTKDSLAIQVLQKEVRELKNELKNQKNDFLGKITIANKEIENLQTQVETLFASSLQIADSLGIKIVHTQNSVEQQIQEVEQKISKNTLYWIIAVLFIVLLLIVLFTLLRKKQQSDKTDIVAQLTQTKQSIDEKLVNEFAEIVGALRAMPTQTTTAEPNHSLALKVASEINLIERNINLMDSKTKGLKQLSRSMEKLKDNLAANGYEIPQLLEKEFNQGMRIIVASSIPDENLEKGVEKITKILIPQVNYNGVMIQTAQIEVSVGY